MTDRNCSVPDCGRPHNCRGYCRPHYIRLRTTGDVWADQPIKYMPRAAERDDVVGRILSRSERSPDGCITWGGTKDANGYGKVHWRGRGWMVHRAIWTVQIGPIPTDDDWTIDHLCRNRACVNVEHLEVVTRWENTRRGGGLLVAQAKNRTRSHCPNGHRYTPDTIYVSATGQRMCKPCKRAMWTKSAPRTSGQRRKKYLERRAAGATPYQALFAEWWKYPPRRPAA